MRSILLYLVLAASLVGCGLTDTMTESLKHSREVASDLEKSVGSKPSVGFNWYNGVLTDVNVNFTGIPSKVSLDQIARFSQQSIATHFKQQPEQVVIRFTVPGS
jgi:hypothetical protein